MEFASSLTLSVYIRKYKLAVNQTLDAIQASADWLKRDQKDVEQVCSARQPLMCMYADGVRPVAEGEQVSLKLGSGLGSMGSSHSELKCKQKCNVSCGVPSDRACVIDSAIKRLQGRAKACGLHDMDTDHQTAQHHMVSLPPHLNPLRDMSSSLAAKKKVPLREISDGSSRTSLIAFESFRLGAGFLAGRGEADRRIPDLVRRG